MKRLLPLFALLLTLSTLAAPSQAGALLSVGSASVSVTGLTVTVNISGIVTGPLLPAASATNYIVYVGGVQDTVVSTAVSGSAHVLTMQQGISQGQTVTLAYAVGNVTDSAGTPNTMQAVTGVAVTNNSTQLLVGPASLAGTVATSGSFTDGTNPSGSSSTLNRQMSNGGQFDFSYHGNGLSVECYAITTTAFTVSIDGAAVTTPTLTASTWQTISAFSGTNGNHTATIKGISTFYVDRLNAFRVTATDTPTTSVTTPGQTVLLRAAVSSAYPAFIDVSPFAWQQTTDLGNYDIFPNAVDGSLKWRGTGTTGSNVEVYSYGSGVTFVKLGVGPANSPNSGAATSTNPGAQMTEQATVTLPADSKFAWRVVGTCPDALEHTFTLSGGSGAGFNVNMIRMDGGTFDTTPLTPRPLWAFVGDSITAGKSGVSVPAGDTTQSWAHLVGEATNYSIANFGVAGSGFYPTTTSPLLGRLAPVIAANPARVTILFGTNDLQQANYSQSLYIASYTQLLNILTTTLPSCKIDCVGIFLRPTADNLTTQINAWSTAISTLAGTYGPNVRFVDSSNALSGGTAIWYNADGSLLLHPDAAHNAIIASDYVAQAFAAAGAPSPTTVTGIGGFISWAAVTNAAGYRVYRDGASVPVYDGAANFYNDEAPAGTHTYTVKAYNAAGDSAASATQTITPPAGVAPLLPLSRRGGR